MKNPNVDPDDEEYEQEDMNYEMAREIEKKKKDAALYDAEQIRLNSENILKVLQVQLTNVLMNLSENQKEISQEINAYWLKELPLRNNVISLLKNMATLINIYTQQEEIYRNTFNDITQAIDFPDYEKIEDSYQQQMNEMRERVAIIKEEADNLKRELQEEFENAVKEESRKERVKVHQEYSELMNQAEEEIKARDKIINQLKSELAASNPNSTFFLNPPPELKIVDDAKDGVIPRSVITGAQTPPLKGFEIIEPRGKSKSEEFKEEIQDDKSDLRDKVTKDILELSFEKNKSYDEVKKIISKKYSTSSFFKYLNELVEEGVIERTGKGKETVLKLIEDDSEPEEEEDDQKE